MKTICLFFIISQWLITVLPNTRSKINRIKGRNRQFHSHIWRFKHSSLTDRLDKIISKDIDEVSNTINRHNLSDVYRRLHQTTGKYTVFKHGHDPHTMLGNKTSLHKFERIKIIDLNQVDCQLFLQIKKIKKVEGSVQDQQNIAIWGLQPCATPPTTRRECFYKREKRLEGL